MGFVAVGASIGGTILPIAARNLIPRVGYVSLINSTIVCNTNTQIYVDDADIWLYTPGRTRGIKSCMFLFFLFIFQPKPMFAAYEATTPTARYWRWNFKHKGI